MQQLLQLYKEYAREEAASCQLITGSGSNRQYYRITSPSGESVIGCVGTSVEENKAFLYLADHFSSKALPVPQILIQSMDGLRYIQQDLGSCSLFDAIKTGREAGGKYSDEEVELLRRTIRVLPLMQVCGAQDLDFSYCYPQPEMDEMNVMFDLNYFKYCYLKLTSVDFHEVRLEHDFRRLAHDITKDKSQTFLYRDFQARNVMLDSDGNPWFIDFQGGRRGPLQYDLASFLWQASARYPDELREELLADYLDELSTLIPDLDIEQFLERLRLFVFFRLLQVLGAYGFRGLIEKKQHFIDSIPPALQSLKQLIEEGVADEYPELKKVLFDLTFD